MKKLGIFLFFILLCNICFGGWWGGTTNTTGGTASTIVASSEAPDAIKARANYVCDGVSDEVEIQAAIDALSSGGVLYLSSGTYNISPSTESVAAIIISTDDFVLNMSPSSILKLVANSVNNPRILKLNSANNITINGGQFDGNKAANTTITGISAMGIEVEDCNDCFITNVVVKNVGTSDNLSGYNIYVKNSSRNIFSLLNLSGAKRENIVLYSDDGSTTNNMIINCLTKDSEDRNIVIHSASGNIIRANQVIDANNAGIQNWGTSNDNIISGNIVRGCGSGIIIESGARIKVQANKVFSNGSLGIHIVATNSFVSSNYCYLNESSGIKLESTSNLVSSNYLWNNGGDGGGADNGITCSSAGDSNYMIDNKCYSTDGQVYGIRFLAGSINNITTNNDLRSGGSTANILDNDGNNVDANNFE